MSLFKCKCCGGDLDVHEGDKVVICSYCGSSQTVPNGRDEQALKIFARGNDLRSKGEFDKAYSTFSQLLNDGKEDAETYWNLLLCKYGITYVDDYDGRKKPTINRMSMSSILDDDDYKKALSLADVVSRENMENEAKRIFEIQNRILKIVHGEKPYDVFISYKETDPLGNRTEDSVLAQDIYDKLTEKGYRVFLSRVTLSEVVGREYEPYIYSALYTAKAMVLVSCDVEYINSVWVRNEWSRYLLMMAKDKDKILVPCYKGVDPYDLPKELRSFQGIDMSKLGWIQDLTMGLKKLIRWKQDEPQKQPNASTGLDSMANQMIQRGFSFLENGKTDKAKNMFEGSLDYADKAMAYIGLLCIELGFSAFDELYAIKEDISSRSNYKKALNVASFDEKEKLEDIVNKFKERQTKGYKSIYDKALQCKKEERYDEAISEFKQITFFLDSKNQLEECERLKEENRLIGIYSEACTFKDEGEFHKAIERFDQILEYRDSKELKDECIRIREENRIEAIYINAVSLKNKQDFDNAIKEFERIPKYKDSYLLGEDCKRLKEEKRKSDIYDKCLKSFKRSLSKNGLLLVRMDLVDLGDYKDSKNIIKEIDAKLKKKKILKISIISTACFCIIASITTIVSINNRLAKEEAERLAKDIQDAIKPKISENSKQIIYGIYPQTHVSNTALLLSLNTLTTAESNGWYLYNNAYYAKLTAKPYESNYTFDDGTKIVSGTTYWFKCEPITWKMLESNNGEYKLLSTVLLDAHCYYSSKSDRTIDGKTIYPNNYKYSDIRSWLNKEFYNTAFSLDNSYIQTTKVDNSASTTASSTNSYACENTNDKVYLLSYQDYLNADYGFSTSYSTYDTARQCKTTDYARANGAWYSTSSDHKKNGFYCARSPSSYSSDAYSVDYDGYLNDYYYVSRTDYSVRPSLSVKVS